MAVAPPLQPDVALMVDIAREIFVVAQGFETEPVSILAVWIIVQPFASVTVRV